MTKRASERLVYDVDEVAAILDIGRNQAYEAIQRGDIPSIRFGRRIKVPKEPFHRLLGVTASEVA